MNSDQDPISELRETLRERPVTWAREDAPRRWPTFAHLSRLPHSGTSAARSSLARVRRAARPHLGGDRRRVGAALSRGVHDGQSFLIAAAESLDVAMDRVARAAGRAAGWNLQVLAAARARVRARRSVSEASIEPGPAKPTPRAADDGVRHLEELERRQLEQRIEALGPDHPDVAILLQLAAERAALHGAPDDALALYARALRIHESTFGPDSPALRPLLADLADLELELGRERDALLHRARGETLARPSAVPAHPDLDGALTPRESHQRIGAARAGS